MDNKLAVALITAYATMKLVSCVIKENLSKIVNTIQEPMMMTPTQINAYRSYKEVCLEPYQEEDYLDYFTHISINMYIEYMFVLSTSNLDVSTFKFCKDILQRSSNPPSVFSLKKTIHWSTFGK